jgi:arylsulfatase A-like enzyme/thioredoxin-like negative regulator of GroEL
MGVLARTAFLICVCLAAFVTAISRPWAQTPSQPDIFLITIDTLRADHLHCYGYEAGKTPTLDELAKDGVRFAQAFTPSPITNTSHTSILTGLLPSTHGVMDFGVPLSESHPTWAYFLKQRNYQTAAFIGAVVLDSRKFAPGLNRGFDYYDNFPEHASGKSRWGRLERRASDVISHTESWVSQHLKGPHFVWAHLYDPHDPYEPPEPYAHLYAQNPYDGEIAYTDAALGTFLTYLKQNKLYENALIIVVGDHGEGLGEHGEETHGVFLYDSTTHIPLIMKLPKNQNAGAVIEQQVRTTDILPTVLEILGFQTSAGIDGQSLKALLDGKSQASLPAYGETDYPRRFGWAPLRSFRSEGFKFIEAPHAEYYDLHADLQELKNLYESWNPGVQKAREALAKLSSQREKIRPSRASSETIAELHALGYLGPADEGSSTNAPDLSSLPDAKDRIQEQNLLHRAMLAEEDNRDKDARVALESVIRNNADSSLALRQLAELQLRSGNYSDAVRYFTRLEALHADDASTALHRGQALKKMGNLTGAAEVLQTSLKLDPNGLSARLLLGSVYQELKNYTAAQDQFEAVLLQQPTNLQAELGAIEAMIGAERYADAIQRLNALASSRGADPQITKLLSQARSGYVKAGSTQRNDN